LEATDHFSLERLLGVSKDELSSVLKLAGVIKVDRKGVECVNKERLKEIFVNEKLTKSRLIKQKYQGTPKEDYGSDWVPLRMVQNASVRPNDLNTTRKGRHPSQVSTYPSSMKQSVDSLDA
jgi:hypothetical protein